MTRRPPQPKYVTVLRTILSAGVLAVLVLAGATWAVDDGVCVRGRELNLCAEGGYRCICVRFSLRWLVCRGVSLVACFTLVGDPRGLVVAGLSFLMGRYFVVV